MSDIFHHFSIKASAKQVFQAVSTPTGLDAWWTKRASGRPEEGAEYTLWYGPGYEWHGVVSRCVQDKEFELEMIDAQGDWRGTHVGFLLDEHKGVTQVRFRHVGWREANEHYRVSCYCWAMYLRLLKRYAQCGEIVPYEDRLEA